MMKRRIETRTFEYMGEVIEYQHVIFERPEECQENPYAEGGRCLADPRDVVEPARETLARDPSGSLGSRGPVCLTRAMFARAFQAEREAGGLGLPGHCVRRLAALDRNVKFICDSFANMGVPMPRRVRRALAGYRPGDLGFAYDRGWYARVQHYLADFIDRRRARAASYARQRISLLV